MRSTLLILAAMAAILLPAPASAVAAPPMEVSVQDDLLLLHRGGGRGQYFNRDMAFQKLRQLHVSSIRVNMIWAHAVADDQAHLRTRPKEVRYDWPAYNALLKLAEGYGIKVQFTITGPAPAWATPSRAVETGWFRPNARQFGKFVHDVATQFDGRVNRYGIWNEPNWHTWLGPGREAPRRYRELYKRAFRAIKRVSPRAQILLGELAPHHRAGHSSAPLTFLRRLTCVNDRYRRTRARRCRGGPLRADGIAHHPYEFSKPPGQPAKRRDDVTIGSLDRMTRALDRLQRARVLLPRRTRRMPLYLTEFGYFRVGPRAIPDRRRARWTVRAFEIARRNPRVRQMLQYVFISPPGGILFDTSIMDHTGHETGSFHALARWSRRAARKKQIRLPGPHDPHVSDYNRPESPAGPRPKPPPPPPKPGPPPEPCKPLVPGTVCF